MDTRHIAENWKSLSERFELACQRAGRRPDQVRVMAVTKTQPVEYLLEAYRLGFRLFGENRVQEAGLKRPLTPADAAIHLIGHLQSNKAKEAVKFAACVQSIDKLSTGQALAKALGERPLDILIEVNTSAEASKDGVRSWDELAELVEGLAACPQLQIRGLMTMAPFTQERVPIVQSFRQLVSTQARLQTAYPRQDWSTLSMGMTNDFELAIAEGSTLIRIGTALFGHRTAP